METKTRDVAPVYWIFRGEEEGLPAEQAPEGFVAWVSETKEALAVEKRR